MRDYLELSKPRIALLVAVTVFIGYWLAGGRDWERLAWSVLGASLAAGATGTLNQYWERERDALMRRTQSRPLPRKSISPTSALIFGLFLAVIGIGVLALKTTLLAAELTVFTIASYVLVYTPLKARTPQSTWIGSVSGAMPPLIGWAAARGSLAPAAWALFAIQFLWQIPHFLALFWMYREDYARAGFKVMPVVDPGGRNTSCQIALHSFALIPASLLPVLSGMARVSYGWFAIALGLAFLALCLKTSWTMAERDARRMFLGSLAYLPLVWGLLVYGQMPAEAKNISASPIIIPLDRTAAMGKTAGEPSSQDYGIVPDFTLVDAHGKTVSRSDLHGPWIADFIFTHCSSQCPIVTAKLKQLGSALPGVQLVSFSVDPDDQPKDLAVFAKMHGAGWTFLTGKADEVKKLCMQGFHLPVGKTADVIEPFIHSTKLVLVDGQDRIRGYFDSDDADSLRRLTQLAKSLR